MDIIVSMFITFYVLIFSAYKGIFVGYSLLLALCIFSFISWRRGFLLSDIIKMSISGGRKSFVVLKIFFLIGCITGIWMASGTVPSIIYYGIKYMNPNFFILYAFIISCVVSFLLGTSLGKDIDKYELAVDLENTGVVLAALIPWNVAALVPTMTMGVSSTGFIPYAFYLYLIPIINVLYFKLLDMKSNKFLSNNYNSK